MENAESNGKKFRAMAENVQAVVAEAKDLGEVFARAVELTAARNGSTIAAVGFADRERDRLEDLCREKNIRLLKPPLRARMEEIFTGLTPADWAVAETGTVVIDSSSEDMRIATMLSEIHVVCVPASRIKADFMEIENFVADRQKNPPCYTAFITGASRTADIERVLAIGVHGPQELHIFLTEECES